MALIRNCKGCTSPLSVKRGRPKSLFDDFWGGFSVGIVGVLGMRFGRNMPAFGRINGQSGRKKT
jgi:hypothetical protein